MGVEMVSQQRAGLVFNIPNSLTLLRISLIPIFMLSFYWPAESRYFASALIFAFAGFTDWLDGFLARKLQQVSPLGEFLDPVADKLIVAVALVLLVEAYATPLLAIPASVIVGREIVISALREWMAELGKRANVQVSYLGKFKTGSQMLAILLLLSQPPIFQAPIVIIGFILLYFAALLTLWSMIQYLRAAWVDIVATNT